RAGGAARRQLRHAAGTPARDLPQLLPAGGTLAVLRAAPGEGRMRSGPSDRSASGLGAATARDRPQRRARVPRGAHAPLPPDAQRPQLATELLAGLARRPRSVSPKFFYDATGSALFDRICELPEYYPTRTEISPLAERAGEIADCIGPDTDIV